MKKTLLFFMSLILFDIFSGAIAETIYVSPNGSGDGSSELSPLGSFSQAVARLDPGDEMVLLDGYYFQTLTLENVNGTASQRITIRAQNLGKATVDAQVKLTHAIRLRNIPVRI